MSFQTKFEFGNSDGNGGNRGGPFGAIVGVLLVIAAFLVFFYVTKVVMDILWILSPFILIASLIIDYKVLLGYIKWIGKHLRANPLIGIGAILLSALLFPLTASFLLGKALLKKKINKAQKEYENKTQGELIEFEEVGDSEIVEDETLYLPPIEKEPKAPSSARKSTDYDNLFD